MAVAVQMLVVRGPTCVLRRAAGHSYREVHGTAKWTDDSNCHLTRGTALLGLSCPEVLTDSVGSLKGSTCRTWASSSDRYRDRRRSLQEGDDLVPSAFSHSTPASYELKELFGMTDHQCFSLFQCPQLSRVPTQTLLDTGSYLRGRGVQKEQLLRLPWILLKDKGSIQMRLAVLLSGRTMFQSAVHGLAFCQYAMPKIRNFRSLFHIERLDLPHHRNRVYFMADKLGVPVPEMTEAVACFRRFGSISLEHILDVMEEFLKLNLPGQSVLRDPWIFLENISLDKRSVQEFAVQYYKGGRAADGHGPAGSLNTPACFIREDSFLHLIANLRIQGNAVVSLRKGRAVMDFLLHEGYTLTDILQNVRVLNYSQERISERLSALHAAELPKVPTICLCYPQSRFETYFESLLKERDRSGRSSFAES